MHRRLARNTLRDLRLVRCSARPTAPSSLPYLASLERAGVSSFLPRYHAARQLKLTDSQCVAGSTGLTASDERVQLDDSFVADVYDKIKEIPAGSVASYGQIARLIGYPKHSRMVGSALKNLPARLHDEVPWQRVVASNGRISARGSIESVATQADLLELEGVTVENRANHGDVMLGPDAGGRVNMQQHGWRADEDQDDRARG